MLGNPGPCCVPRDPTGAYETYLSVTRLVLACSQAVSDEELWDAKRRVDAAIHPFTKETIPPPVRMAAFTPVNIPICTSSSPLADCTAPPLRQACVLCRLWDADEHIAGPSARLALDQSGRWVGGSRGTNFSSSLSSVMSLMLHERVHAKHSPTTRQSTTPTARAPRWSCSRSSSHTRWRWSRPALWPLAAARSVIRHRSHRSHCS